MYESLHLLQNTINKLNSLGHNNDLSFIKNYFEKQFRCNQFFFNISFIYEESIYKKHRLHI